MGFGVSDFGCMVLGLGTMESLREKKTKIEWNLGLHRVW